MDMVAQHLFQGRVQQMGGTVSPHDGLAPLHINGGGDTVSHLELAGDHLADVEELTALVLLDVGHLKCGAAGGDHAGIGHLAAHLGIEGRLVQNQRGLRSGGHSIPQLLLRHDGQDLALGLGVVVA